MKNLRSVFIMAMAFLALQTKAQEKTFQTDSKSRIEPLRLGISFQKTTNLIFPYAIKSVDRGSADVLVQKAKGVENVLQLKSAKDTFQETNLSVIAGDGLLYSFVLHYSNQPTILNLELVNKPMGYQPIAIFSQEQDNQKRILTSAEYVSAKKITINGPSDRKSNIGIWLDGVFIKDGVIYYQLELENGSNIPYDIEQLRFFVRDKKKSKRTASQELEQVPLYIHGNATVVHEQSIQVLVVALPKFTIPDKKELIVQLMEKNGGRHLSFKINNRYIMRALPFN